MSKHEAAEREGGACPDCGTPAEWYECRACGDGAWLIDCGHYPQPRPISGEDDVAYCDVCWAAKEAAEEDAT